MPDGSIQEVDWAFGTRLPDDKVAELQCRIVSIWAVSATLAVLDNLGSGFVLRSATDSKGRQVIIVGTAEHVLDGSVRPLRPDVDSSRHGLFAPPLVRLVSPMLRKRQLIVSITTDKGLINYSVNGVAVSRRSDLCLLKAVAMTDLSGFPQFVSRTALNEAPIIPVPAPTFAIDSDPLPVGTHVILVGYPQAHDPRERAKQTFKPGRVTVARQPSLGLQVRHGRIVEVCERMRHKPVLGYETNIPMPAGMSGGPVFAFDENLFSPLSVVGICSFDAKAWEPGNDVASSGSSFIVASENFYCVPDPSSANHRAWKARKPGERVPPPFANFFVDIGKRKSEIRVYIDQESESPAVRRLPS